MWDSPCGGMHSIVELLQRDCKLIGRPIACVPIAFPPRTRSSISLQSKTVNPQLSLLQQIDVHQIVAAGVAVDRDCRTRFRRATRAGLFRT